MIEKQEIKENATITMKESLTVIGDIKSGVKISLDSPVPCELIVKGKIHNDVEIRWRGSIIFEQDFLGSNIRVINHEKDISAKSLGENACLKTHKGNIIIESTAENNQLISHVGNITVQNLSKSEVRVHGGNVTIAMLKHTSTIIVHNGNVTIKDHLFKSNVSDATTIKIYRGNLYTSKCIEKQLNSEIFVTKL